MKNGKIKNGSVFIFFIFKSFILKRKWFYFGVKYMVYVFYIIGFVVDVDGLKKNF